MERTVDSMKNKKNHTTLSDDMMIPAIKWMAEQIPGGFFVYTDDDTQRLIYVNTVCLQLFGCETFEEFRELTGFTFKGMVHPEDYAAISSSIEEQIVENDDNIDCVEYRIIRKDGAVRWVDDYGHYMETNLYGGVYTVFISDITEKRERIVSALALRCLCGRSSPFYLRHYSEGLLNATFGSDIDYAAGQTVVGFDGETPIL